MSPRTAIPFDHLSRLVLPATCDAAGVALGVLTLDAAALAAGNPAAPDDWVRVAPRGEITTRDGRRYVFEPERLVARFAADGIEIPIDIDHAISKKPMFGDKADAVGWVKALEARDDGLWARIELLDAGRAVLTARTHRFVSPTFHHTEAGLATWLHSVALVAAPALAMAAIAAAVPAHNDTSNQEQSMLKAIAKALGLAETADEAACLAALTTLQSGKVDKAVHEQALATLAATNEKLATATAQLAARDKADHDAKVTALLEGALTAKKIVPAQRDQYAALCATAEGLAQVTALLAATPAGLQPSDLDRREVPAGGPAATDALLAKAHALIDTAAKAGRTLSLADAVVEANGGTL